MILDTTFPIDPRVSNEASALIKKGHEVYLFCLSYKKKFIKEETINHINVRRYYCSTLTYKLSALAYSFPFYRVLMKNKISHFLKKNRIETIHIHDIQIASAVFSANKYNLPVSLDLHENRPEIMNFYKHVNSLIGKIFINPKKWKIAEEKYCNISDNVVVVTKSAKKELLKRVSVDPQKIIVFPNTVNKDFYNEYSVNKSILNKFSDNFVLLYLGNTSERRGLDLVMKSLPIIKDYIPNIKLVIVGSSSFDKSLLELSRKLKVESYISFEGWKDESYFPSYLSIANIGISPLKSNIHHDTTYANKIFQYMSFGVPLLASDVVSQEEIITKFKVGKLFVSENLESFINTLKNLYENKDSLEYYSKNGRIAIEKYLNNDIVSKELSSMYDK